MYVRVNSGRERERELSKCLNEITYIQSILISYKACCYSIYRIDDFTGDAESELCMYLALIVYL